VVGPKKTTPPSARTVSGNKRVVDLDDDDDDDQDASGGGSPQRSDSAVKKHKINRNGLVTLTNGVVSMRELVLSTAVPTKGRDDDACTLFDAKLSWGHSYALFTLVMCGKEHPVEKARDLGTRLKIMFSAAPYSISEASLSEIIEAEPEQRHAYLHGMAKAAQQKLRYVLYGQVSNLFNEKVFTKNGVQPSETVKLYLGLSGLVPERGLMDM
jgi:hypothetical protein